MLAGRRLLLRQSLTPSSLCILELDSSGSRPDDRSHAEIECCDQQATVESRQIPLVDTVAQSSTRQRHRYHSIAHRNQHPRLGHCRNRPPLVNNVVTLVTTSVLAGTLGLWHALDANHISAYSASPSIPPARSPSGKYFDRSSTSHLCLLDPHLPASVHCGHVPT